MRQEMIPLSVRDEIRHSSMRWVGIKVKLIVMIEYGAIPESVDRIHRLENGIIIFYPSCALDRLLDS